MTRKLHFYLRLLHWWAGQPARYEYRHQDHYELHMDRWRRSRPRASRIFLLTPQTDRVNIDSKGDLLPKRESERSTTA